MSKHTPGPWTVGYEALDVMAQDDKGSFKVCDIRGWGHLTGKGHGALGLGVEQARAIQVANANLIAAAPDLLAELTNLVECLELAQRNDDLPLPFAGYGLAHLTRARAVVTMATGPDAGALNQTNRDER